MFPSLRIFEQQLFKYSYGGYYVAANSFASEKLTSKQVCAVQNSWKSLSKDSDRLALDFFSCVFEKKPEYTKLFKRFGDCPDDILGNDCFIRGHVIGKVFNSLEGAIKKLGNPCELNSFLLKLGKKHVKYCMTCEHFQTGQVCLMKAIEKNSCEMECSLKTAWSNAVEIIFAGMIKGLSKGDD